MTLPASGAITMQQIAAEMSITGPMYLDRADLAALRAVASTFPNMPPGGGAHNLTAYYSRSCETYDITVGPDPGGSGQFQLCGFNNAAMSGQGAQYGSSSRNTFRGIGVPFIRISPSGITQFGIMDPNAQANFMRGLLLRPGAGTTSLPYQYALSGNAVMGAGSGLNFWQWNYSSPPNWQPLIGQVVRAQALY